MTDAVIRTDGLTKRFGRRAAVDDVALVVPRGAVYGFLGPNGAGKTTTIRMLLGLVAPDAGTVQVLGHDMPRAARDVLPRVGAFVEGPAFYPYLTGAQNLLRMDAADPASYRRDARRRAAVALERVGLTRAADKRVHGYSLGMRQRLGLANVLLRPREVLVLDEPTNGLDPQGTREVRALVRELAADGTTVFVSSHLLAEIEQMCTHAAVMRAGRIVAQGTLDDLGGGRMAEVVVHTPDAVAARRVLRGLGIDAAAGVDDRPASALPVPVSAVPAPAVPVSTGPAPAVPVSASAVSVPSPRMSASASADPTAVVRAPLPPDPPAAEAVVAALVAAGVRVRGFAIERPRLEERYVALTGEGFDVDG